jgi:hypothetical protein
MKLTTLLGTTALVAAMMMLTNDASASPTCWGIPGGTTVNGGGSCCWEERHTVLGAPTNAAVVQAPSLVTADGGKTYDVFAQGWDSALWTRRFDGKTWSGWSSLGGVTTSRPTAVAAGAGRIYVFARGTDNAVWYRDRTSMVWGPWRTLGGYIIGGIGAAAWSSGEVELFAQGGDKALWKNSLIGTTAGGWSSLGGTLYGEPAATNIAYSGGGESIEVWVMASDKQLWRRKHDRTPIKIGFTTTTLDVWKNWQVVMSGMYGGPGLVNEGVVGFLSYVVRDAIGRVWAGTADSTGVKAFHQVSPIATRSDVCVAPGQLGAAHYAYVDRDTAVVKEFHYEKVCSTCGDGRCYGAETCSSCPSDCGACGPTCGNGRCESGESCSSCPGDCGACPTNSCQDYSFCSKADLWATTGTTIQGFGCNITDARKDAWKKVIGGVLADGPCPPAPSVCGGKTPWVAEWCCKKTGTTYWGIGCTKSEADNNAHVDSSCSTWSEGICD